MFIRISRIDTPSVRQDGGVWTWTLTVSAGGAREGGLGAVADVSVPALCAGAAVHAGVVVAVPGHLVARGTDRT